MDKIKYFALIIVSSSLLLTSCGKQEPVQEPVIEEIETETEEESVEPEKTGYARLEWKYDTDTHKFYNDEGVEFNKEEQGFDLFGDYGLYYDGNCLVAKKYTGTKKESEVIRESLIEYVPKYIMLESQLPYLSVNSDIDYLDYLRCPYAYETDYSNAARIPSDRFNSEYRTNAHILDQQGVSYVKIDDEFGNPVIAAYFNNSDQGGYLPETITVDGETYNVTVLGKAPDIDNWEVPPFIEGILEWSFSHLGNTKTITIPDTVKWVHPSHLFYDSESVEYIRFPKAEYYSWQGTALPFSITDMESGENYHSDVGGLCPQYEFSTMPSDCYMYNLGVLVLEHTFSRCYNLKEIDMPDDIYMALGEDAFSECHSLKAIPNVDNIIKLGSGALHGTKSLETSDMVLRNKQMDHIVLAALNGSAITNMYIATDPGSTIGVVTYGASKLKLLYICDSFDYWDNADFTDMWSLEYLKFPQNVSREATSGIKLLRDKSLKYVILPENITDMDKLSFIYDDSTGYQGALPYDNLTVQCADSIKTYLSNTFPNANFVSYNESEIPDILKKYNIDD